MLALTRKTDYALIALSILAERSAGVISARAISGACGVPLAMLTNILKTLGRARIVVSERGASGGYRLARPPEGINLYEVIVAVEGQVYFVRCMQANDEVDYRPCGLEPSCPVRRPAHGIQRRFRQFLESLPLSELLEPDSEPQLVTLTGPAGVQPSEITAATMERPL